MSKKKAKEALEFIESVGKKSFEDRALLALSFEDLEYLYQDMPWALQSAKDRKVQLMQEQEKERERAKYVC